MRNRSMVGEEYRIKESGDSESQEGNDQLAKLHELEGRHDALTDDLYGISDISPWGDLRHSNVIHIDWKESSMPASTIEAFNVDPDYYRAYYAKYGSNLHWSNEYYSILRTGVVPESVTQRIVSKWEQLSAQPVPQ